ncbi:protein translocase subunit SecD [Streptomyces boninensis]|uniref:protein translocase subunit SecD n=1 Tax=Streptomyces boninensis TaxID=2039455 RepID=UPI003B220DF3
MAAPNRGQKRARAAQGRPGRTLVFMLIALVALTGGIFFAPKQTPRLGIDLAGGTSITLEAKELAGKKGAINKKNMDTAVGIIERRVNGLGVSEAEVQTQGDRHIIVNIPKGTNQKTAREQVGTTAQLYFRPVLTVADAAAQKQPEKKPDPTPSASSSGKGDDKKSPSPSDSATKQGRALSEGLKQADAQDDPSKTPKPGSSDAKKQQEQLEEQLKQQQQQQQPPGVPADVAKKLEKLDCTSQEARSKASQDVASSKTTDTVVACDEKGQAKYALGPVKVEGVDIKKAQATFDQQSGSGWIVEMQFNDKGTSKFTKVTTELSKQQQPMNQFAIELDGEVISAPSVSNPIPGGNAQISGSFTQESADSLANVLSYGALPLSFEEASVDTVSAALGSDQLHAGLIAGAIGLALVVIYLVAYYRGLALVAIASLIVSAILTYTLMTLLGPAIGFALNLPAVCGAIVAIGITTDSFIVYFERIRDELRHGRTLRPSVERAWPRARRTILVADFVSFLAAAVLFAVTVGKVQGFAFTLGLTTILDVVVVFLFTKPLMTLLARRPFFADGHPWSGLDPKRLGINPPLRRRGRRSAPGTGPIDPKEA